jgi:hypothetical protein
VYSARAVPITSSQVERAIFLSRYGFGYCFLAVGSSGLSEEERAADWDQTAIYPKFNAIDGQSPQAGGWVDDIPQNGALERIGPTSSDTV